MTIIAIDLQPQCQFACRAANDQQCIHEPSSIAHELNQQARLAHKRLLIENVSSEVKSLCNQAGSMVGMAHLGRNHFTVKPERVYSSQTAFCQYNHLFAGLPCPADYDEVICTQGHERNSACFHDEAETRSTGLIEYLYQAKAQTVIIGGLATEYAVAQTAAQLNWYGDKWHVIVNLSACRGYTPESTIKAITQLRQQGVTVVLDHKQLVHTIATSPQLILKQAS